MQFDEMGRKDGKTLMLLPGTACDYQTNFGTVLDRLAAKYHLICVNYDGFDGSDLALFGSCCFSVAADAGGGGSTPSG